MTTTVNIRMDAGLKQEAAALFADLGMSFTTAMNCFVREAVRKRNVPFKIPQYEPSDELLAAMEETERILQDPNMKAYDSVDEFLKDLKS